MKRKMTGAAGLTAAFVAGMLVATALGGGMSGAKAAAQAPAQQVTVKRIISPTIEAKDARALGRTVVT